MVKQILPKDFREFLRLLSEVEAEYLLVGGYAVGYHGYPRTTADMDVWVEVSPENASKLAEACVRFGMRDAKLTPELFRQHKKVIRMGVPPMRIEIHTGLDGVEFQECFAAREVTDIDGVPVNVISLRHLRANKRASGRHRDLDHLEHLPLD